MFQLYSPAVRSQLWEFREQPVSVLEEAVLVVFIETVPELVCPALVLILPWLGQQWR